MRSDWSNLPPEVLDAVKGHTGTIHRVEPAPAGNHADIAATVHTADGRLFVKAAPKTAPDTDGPEVRSLRWEAAINPHVTEYAARLHWTVEAGGWLVLAFEHVQARHADYTPGSPDLDVLAKIIDSLQARPLPDVLERKRIERRWESMGDMTPLAGNTLLHADLNPANVLIGDDNTVHVVDWTFTGRGAAFLEMALLIPWLLKAGHTPAEAERWTSRFPAWTTTAPATIDLFARVFATKWQANLATNNEAWALEHATAAQRWASHRHARSSAN
ncbi:phosphotransferase family protein [Actinomadura bangladeshensis]|uniref:Aminoglycoside phosphotransferase n=1 Tax=Actinomadura bangladeshensis TaxID=453573 RepID=A0A4R4NQW9_9ACTN|nr:phosphotransferase [Actinomadura bangladeshensis]TDC12001.1 aminoglycoside phosphotransferase [Actinomadura bangladeshensis]